MAISKKSKFFAASLSAAVTVSAVAPTILAAELPEDSQGLQDNEKEALALLMEAGVVKGDADTGAFRPGDSITRAEASSMLSAILELDVDNAPAADFPDVDQDAWYAKYVNAVADEGIVVGDEEGNFNWNDTLTRAEFAQMVFKAYGLEASEAELPFEDLVEDAWYSDAITTLYADELIAGQTDTTFGPNESIRRVDTARLLAVADLQHGTYLNSFIEAPAPEVESVSAINAESPNYTSTIGNDVTVKYTVTDKEGNAVSGVDVVVNADDNANVEDRITQTLTTDANGVVEFTYSRVSPGVTDTISAYVKDKAIVRTSAASVVWNLAEGNVSVDVVQNQDNGVGTEVTYVATFTDKDGNTLDAGTKVYANLNNALIQSSNTTLGTDSDFAQSGTSEELVEYTLVEGDNGQATLVFTHDSEATITPTFYYDNGGANSDATLDLEDPRVIAGATSFKAQVPTFTLTEKVDSDVAAVGSTKVYTLTAVDQFGKPFLGTVQLANASDLDNLAGNDGNEGSIVFDTDLDQDDTFENTSVTTVNFSSDDDGVADVQLSGGASGDKTSLVAWYDTNTDTAGYDVNDSQVKATEVTFEALEVASLETSAYGETTVGQNKDVDFKLSFKDQNGDAVNINSEDLVVQVVKSDDTLASDVTASSALLDLESSVASYEADPSTADWAEGTGSGTNFTYTASTETDMVVRFNSDSAGTYKVRAFVDGNSDGVLQADELSTVTSVITVETDVLTSGLFTAAPTASVDDTAETFTYELRDQDDQAFAITDTVKYTVANTGDISVDVDGTTVAAGETKVIDAALTSASSDSIVLTPSATTGASVTVTAQVNNKPVTAVTESIVWEPIAVDTSATTTDGTYSYSGTVLLVDNTNDYYVISTALGNVKVDTTAGNNSYSVDGNTATNTQFENKITVGDTVEFTQTVGSNTISTQNNKLTNK